MAEIDASAQPSDLPTRRCPVCEYDLFGNTSGRCPECGTVVVSAAASHLPWMYRHARGGITAYFQTISLLLFHPDRLAQEAERRVPLAAARRFHLESLILATVLGTGLFILAFSFRGSRWEAFLSPSVNSLFGIGESPRSLFTVPLFVWSDRLLVAVPVIPALYLSLRFTAWQYRQLFRWGDERSAIEARRGERLALYGSGLAPVITVLAGTLATLYMLLGEEWAWAVGSWTGPIEGLCALLVITIAAAFYVPTIVLLNALGAKTRATKAKLGIALALFPLLQLCAWTLITLTLAWLLGYAAIAAWSMLH